MRSKIASTFSVSDRGSHSLGWTNCGCALRRSCFCELAVACVIMGGLIVFCAVESSHSRQLLSVGAHYCRWVTAPRIHVSPVLAVWVTWTVTVWCWLVIVLHFLRRLEMLRSQQACTADELYRAITVPLSMQKFGESWTEIQPTSVFLCASESHRSSNPWQEKASVSRNEHLQQLFGS